MLDLNRFFTFCILLVSSALFSMEPFTVGSYNCGGLSDHYDYIRAVSLQQLVQERHNQEPKEMALLERIQNTAIKILFSTDEEQRLLAQKEWDERDYQTHIAALTTSPQEEGSINSRWRNKSEEIVSSYNERPVRIYDLQVKATLLNHAKDITAGQGLALEPTASLNEWLDPTRQVMAERIFSRQMAYDILALQEADYLESSFFPESYATYFSDNHHSVNGVAWNKQRFVLEEEIGDIDHRAFVVVLRDLLSGEKIAFASAHLSGCNPFTAVRDSSGQSDSAKGDEELERVLSVLAGCEADHQIIAMDSNVTATHPRLRLLRDSGYRLDAENYLEPTCTSPWQILNTRIDWIAIHSEDSSLSISNIPTLAIGLNSPQTNISDHKPIAARIHSIK